MLAIPPVVALLFWPQAVNITPRDETGPGGLGEIAVREARPRIQSRGRRERGRGARRYCKTRGRPTRPAGQIALLPSSRSIRVTASISTEPATELLEL